MHARRAVLLLLESSLILGQLKTPTYFLQATKWNYVVTVVNLWLLATVVCKVFLFIYFLNLRTNMCLTCMLKHAVWSTARMIVDNLLQSRGACLVPT
jgi:hypothetical protein